MHNLTLGSLFDGSGGFTLAGMMAGITPIWTGKEEINEEDTINGQKCNF